MEEEARAGGIEVLEAVAEVVDAKEGFEADLGVGEDFVGVDATECRGDFGVLFGGSGRIEGFGLFKDVDDDLIVPEAGGKWLARDYNLCVGKSKTH